MTVDHEKTPAMQVLFPFQIPSVRKKSSDKVREPGNLTKIPAPPGSRYAFSILSNGTVSAATSFR